MGYKPPILMFYDGYERKARDKAASRAFHAARSRLRALVRRLRGKQVNTGFYEAFLAIVNGLERLGYEVRINDFAYARKHPSYPIGLAGYPEVIDHVRLPNPVIFGPGDPGYPDAAEKFAALSSTKLIIQPSDWFVEYYRPFCGAKMIRCPVGINIEKLPDTANDQKSCDVLVYDKIRWNRETVVPLVLDRLTDELKARGLTFEVVRYGYHSQSDYFSKLARSRSMAFLCEHETQGLACEEALAMNVPVFAWDEGKLIDPLQKVFAKDGLVVSSVPYFDDRCGVTFTLAELEARLDQFWAGLPRYTPRTFVAETLSPEVTAQVYLQAYLGMMTEPGKTKDDGTDV